MAQDSNDDPGDFADYSAAEDPEDSTDEQDGKLSATVNIAGLEETQETIAALSPIGADNPTGIDPRPGKGDLCYDRAKPGAKVYVVERLAPSVALYRERYPDAPRLDEFEGNVLSRIREADAVFAAVYVKDTLTSTNFTAYPMPESRLTRFPAEEADLIGDSSVEFTRANSHEPEQKLRDALADAEGRLDGAEPKEIPEDAERDEDGEAVFTEEDPDA